MTRKSRPGRPKLDGPDASDQSSPRPQEPSSPGARQQRQVRWNWGRRFSRPSRIGRGLNGGGRAARARVDLRGAWPSSDIRRSGIRHWCRERPAGPDRPRPLGTTNVDGWLTVLSASNSAVSAPLPTSKRLGRPHRGRRGDHPAQREVHLRQGDELDARDELPPDRVADRGGGRREAARSDGTHHANGGAAARRGDDAAPRSR